MTTKSAFTLMEVLIAVMLISIVVTGILRVGSQERKVIAHAINRSKVSEKVSLFIDTLKPQKEQKKIKFDLYLKNLKIDSSDKKKLNDIFTYNSFLSKAIGENSTATKQENTNQKNSIFEIYKQTFRDKNGYTVSYYRIIRQ